MEQYNFPSNNPNPFNEEFSGNYFVIADKYSNLSVNRSDFNFKTFEKNIPIGYKSIITCKRILIIENRRINRLSESDKVEKTKNEFIGKYILTSEIEQNQFMSEWNRNVQSFIVYKSDALNASLKSSCWNDLESCEDYATELASKHNGKFIVSQIIDTIYWH